MTEHPSYLTYVYVDLAGGTSWSKVAQLKDITGPSMSRDDIEVTHRDLPNNFKVFWGGYADGGEVSWDMIWDPNDALHIQGGTATGIISDLERKDQTQQSKWKWESDIDGGTAAIVFDGYLNSFEISAPENDALQASCTVKINGKPTLTIS